MTPEAERLAQQLGTTLDDLMRRADRHTMAVQAWLSSRSPDAARYNGSGIRASSTGLPVPLLNLALGGKFPDNTSDNEIRAEIEAVKRFFRGRGVKDWYWWLGADLHPTDMAQRLEKTGFVFDRPALPLLVAQIPALMKPQMSEDIVVWQAKTIQDLAAASTIRRVAFRFPRDAGKTYFEDMADSWLNNPKVKLYLAGRDRHLPEAIGALIEDDDEGLAGIYVMATLPDAQRQGYGKVILNRATIDATAARHRILILTASEKGIGLYQQFRFIPLFNYSIYRSQEV
jgi:GNAT superfamily N-acetyltransferase